MTDNERRELTAAELDLVVGAASDGLPIESISFIFAGSSHSRGVSRGVACDGIGACIP